MEVYQILTSMGADNNLVIAGLLHDTIEDTNASIENIKYKFVEDVASLVEEHTEDKSKLWYIRKLNTINNLLNDDTRSKLLTLVDKLSNLRSMYRDYMQIGDELWLRINAPKKLQSWYYSKIIDALKELQNISTVAPYYWELVELYKDLFVKFYIRTEQPLEEEIYQVAIHGECYCLKHNELCWNSYNLKLPDNVVQVSRQFAEQREDEWNRTIKDICLEDITDNSYNLYSSNSRTLRIEIKDGILTFYGEDYGKQCLKTNGKDEYNFIYYLNKEDAQKIIQALRRQFGFQNNLKTVLKKNFGTSKGSLKFVGFCNKNDIKYKFYSF